MVVLHSRSRSYLVRFRTQDVVATYKKITTLLQQALAQAPPKTKGFKEDPAEQPAAHSMLDLLATLATSLDVPTARALLKLACSEQLLQNSDSAVQKKSYRILVRMSETEVGKKAILPKLEELLKQLTESTAPVSAAAKKVCKF